MDRILLALLGSLYLPAPRFLLLLPCYSRAVCCLVLVIIVHRNAFARDYLVQPRLVVDHAVLTRRQVDSSFDVQTRATVLAQYRAHLSMVNHSSLLPVEGLERLDEFSTRVDGLQLGILLLKLSLDETKEILVGQDAARDLSSWETWVIFFSRNAAVRMGLMEQCRRP